MERRVPSKVSSVWQPSIFTLLYEEAPPIQNVSDAKEAGAQTFTHFRASSIRSHAVSLNFTLHFAGYHWEFSHQNQNQCPSKLYGARQVVSLHG